MCSDTPQSVPIPGGFGPVSVPNGPGSMSELCPHCGGRAGFTRTRVEIGERVRESLKCKTCRQTVHIREGTPDELKLQDDITRLEGKVDRTGSESLRRTLAARRRRLTHGG